MRSSPLKCTECLARVQGGARQFHNRAAARAQAISITPRNVSFVLCVRLLGRRALHALRRTHVWASVYRNVRDRGGASVMSFVRALPLDRFADLCFQNASPSVSGR